MTHLLGRAGRLHMAWYILRGHTVVYRATIRDGGLDMREYGKAIVQEVQIYGADTGLHLPGPDVPIYQVGKITEDGKEIQL